MSVITEIRASLDTMGVEQQVCVFVFLMSYPLTLGALLEARGRRYAAAAAAAAALGFVLTTHPWMHAVLLIVLAIGGIGVFIAIVTSADHVYRRVSHPVLLPETLPEMEIPAAASVPSGRERVPIGQPVSVES